MSILSGLFQNEKVKDAAFGMVKKQMRENGMKYFVIEYFPASDEISLNMYKEADKPVILSEAQLSKMADTIDRLSENQKVVDNVNSNDPTTTEAV